MPTDQAAAGAAHSSAAKASLFNPIFAGMLAAIVGFASSFAVVLKGFAAAGASPVEAASGLLAVSIAMGLLGILVSTATRMPISIAWSTPGSALLIATGAHDGGFAAAAGAFLVAGLLVVAAGLWKPFGRAVAAIPASLASAMLAGVLLDLCLAPVKAVAAMPLLALPVVLAWAVTWRFARLYAVPAAVLVAGIVIAFAVKLPSGILAELAPNPVFIAPVVTWETLVGIALPLFVVTMASQNIPGLAVLNANGYRPEVGPLFVVTGLGSAAAALFGGHAVNLAAITAAICAGPDSHPDPTKRWWAGAASGLTYCVFGLFAGVATAFVAASPPLLIQAVAGLALLGSLASALATALSREDERIPAALTFITAASGISIFGVGAAFWGLIAGGALLALSKTTLPR